MSKEQLDRLQQEQNAGGRLKSRNADVQQSEKIGAADREDDEHHAGNGNGLDRQPAARRPAGAARQYSENRRGFDRADRNQQHDDCRGRKFEVASHLMPGGRRRAGWVAMQKRRPLTSPTLGAGKPSPASLRSAPSPAMQERGLQMQGVLSQSP